MAIPNVTAQYHHIGDVQEKIGMSMRVEDFPHIAELLNSPYSNPLLAVIREYSTNAIDSHVMAGNPAPIEITLPTEDSMTFIVQDYGLGMSVDDLRETYSMYGRSDKRGTNAVAGQLGLGSKSGLAYTAMFMVIGVKNGVKVTAYVTKDEQGLGEIDIKDTVGTDEPNGVRIMVPVDRWDVSRFRSEAEGLFQFWEPGTVLIDGEAPAEPAWKATALRLDDDLYLVRDDAGLYRSYVIMGNVPYPVDDADVGRTSQRFVARLNMGDVDFPMSREEVKHTPHTDATLAELSEYVKATRKRAIDEALSNVGSRWDETLLRVLWMDRNQTLKADQDSPIWTFDPSGYGTRKARANVHMRIDALAQPSTTVITEFGAKNVSTAARVRLEEFAADKGVKPYFVIIAASTPGMGALEGRPNTFTWDEVVGATDEPVVAGVKVKRKKYETRYETNYGPLTGSELSELDETVLYLMPNERSGRGDLGAVIVSLRASNQLPRIRRFVPKIDTYLNEVERQAKVALAAVTDDDKAILRARHLSSPYTSLPADGVDDPELAEYIRLHDLPDTPTLARAKALGAAIEPGKAIKWSRRYPLLSENRYYYDKPQGFEADALFYINAKYADTLQLSLDTKAS